MAKLSKKRAKPSPKKPTKKSRNKVAKSKKGFSPLLKILTLIVLCFGLGAMTYKILDTAFGDTTKTEISKESEISKKPKISKENREKIQEKTKEKSSKALKKPKEFDEISKDSKDSKDDNKTIKEIPIIAMPEESEILLENIPKSRDFVVKEFRGEKPKLVIIIDDVANFSHVKEIKEINLKLTPSIFPKDKFHPDTPKIAASFEFFMIHLPLEAQNYNSNRIKTLKADDNFEAINSHIKSIRENFPKAVFINNHTGSKFSSDEKAMRKLLRSLKSQGFIHLDSRTIASNVTKNLSKEFGLRYIYRDVFLDNVDEVGAIKNELKKAVKIAKSRGYAIAIAHPRKATFRALKTSGEILKDVEVVYLKDVYEYYK